MNSCVFCKDEFFYIDRANQHVAGDSAVPAGSSPVCHTTQTYIVEDEIHHNERVETPGRGRDIPTLDHGPEEHLPQSLE